MQTKISNVDNNILLSFKVSIVCRSWVQSCESVEVIQYDLLLSATLQELQSGIAHSNNQYATQCIDLKLYHTIQHLDH